jgi:hypothetical protein
MKTNARYIITTAGIAAGLFTIGATANALSSDSTAAPDPIGAAVVLPSASADPSASPSLVEVEYAEGVDPSPVVLPDATWSTGPGSAGDDDDDSDDDSSDDSDDDSDDDSSDDSSDDSGHDSGDDD